MMPSIVELLDNYLLKDYEEFSKERHYNPLRPSSAGKCERALFYENQEFRKLRPVTKETRSPSVIRLLSFGSTVEKSLIWDLKKLEEKGKFAVKYMQQSLTVLKLDDGTIIEGNCDFAIEGDEYKILCDSKSAKDGFSASYQTRWQETLSNWESMPEVVKIGQNTFEVEDTESFVEMLGDDFKTDNITQLNLYCGSDFFQERGYEWCSLFYYIKNDSNLYELRFRYSPELREKTKQKFQRVHNATKEDDTEKEYALGSIRCAFCSFKDDCWPENDAKKNYIKENFHKKWPTDLNKMQNNDKLAKLFADYEEIDGITSLKQKVEDDILIILDKLGINKIKLTNGHVYDVKRLKSPKEHLELRRSKL